MPCPSHEELIRFAAGESEPASREAVSAHVAGGCEACAAEHDAIVSLRRLASAGTLEDPAPWVLARAARIPEEARAGSLLRRLGVVAARVFDTLADPLPRGARSSDSSTRQVLYRALDYDVDVRIAPAPTAGGVVLTGQILPGSDRDIDVVAGLDVVLTREGRQVASGTTNEIGEFALPSVAAGRYDLVVDAAEDALVIEDISTEIA